MMTISRWSSGEAAMSLVETAYEHIVIGDDQIPVIEGTTMKVVESWKYWRMDGVLKSFI